MQNSLKNTSVLNLFITCYWHNRKRLGLPYKISINIFLKRLFLQIVNREMEEEKPSNIGEITLSGNAP